jgi:uncharacterized protein (TIGR03067 family)
MGTVPFLQGDSPHFFRTLLLREATMKTRLAVLVLLEMMLASGGAAAGGDAGAELKKFEGTWAAESAREEGKDAPEFDVKKIAFTFTGNKVAFRYGDEDRMEGTFQIDPGKKPAHIDVTIKGEKAPGIYVFEGGKLKLCIGTGKARPTEFRSPAGSKTTLYVLKRLKK